MPLTPDPARLTSIGEAWLDRATDNDFLYDWFSDLVYSYAAELWPDHPCATPGFYDRFDHDPDAPPIEGTCLDDHVNACSMCRLEAEWTAFAETIEEAAWTLGVQQKPLPSSAPEPLRYEVGRRNGYFAIDAYRGDRCESNIAAGLSRKNAELFAGRLNDAYRLGHQDAR